MSLTWRGREPSGVLICLEKSLTYGTIGLTTMTSLAPAWIAMSMFVVDAQGNLEFYNEYAEILLGLRFDETGPMPVDEWASLFSPTNDDGAPLPIDELPLVGTLRDHEPRHGSFSIRGLDGMTRRLSVTSIPLLGRQGVLVGAAALFWESRE